MKRIFYSVAHDQAKEHESVIQEFQSNQDMNLSMDEVAVRNGHGYETVLYNANLGAVMGMHQNRHFNSTLELLLLKVQHPEKVKNVVVDMWDTFHKAVRKAFPHTRMIVDRYHVVQKMTMAFD